jgi:hypothetical protein
MTSVQGSSDPRSIVSSAPTLSAIGFAIQVPERRHDLLSKAQYFKTFGQVVPKQVLQYTRLPLGGARDAASCHISMYNWPIFTYRGAVKYLINSRVRVP